MSATKKPLAGSWEPEKPCAWGVDDRATWHEELVTILAVGPVHCAIRGATGAQIVVETRNLKPLKPDTPPENKPWAPKVNDTCAWAMHPGGSGTIVAAYEDQFWFHGDDGDDVLLTAGDLLPLPKKRSVLVREWKGPGVPSAWLSEDLDGGKFGWTRTSRAHVFEVRG